MSNQGFFGALQQYWTVDEAPRLNRRNTFFDDAELSNWDALRFCIGFSILAIAIITFWSIMGNLL